MAQSAIKRRRDFTSGPLLPQIFGFAIPLMLSSILQHTFNTADTLMVGRWGGITPDACENALAAVGSTSSLISLLTDFFIGPSVGVSVCVGFNVGAKRYDMVKKTMHTAATVSFITGAIIVVLGCLLARPALIWMGTEPAVLDEAVPYVMAYMCGMPAMVFYSYCSAGLRATGDTVRPLIFLTAGGVANVVLNAVMTMGFHAGALGVGVATAVSQWVSCIMLIIYLRRSDGLCRLEFRSLGIDKEVLKKMVTVGIPVGIENSLFSISNVLITSSVNSFGKVVVAGNAVAKSIDHYMDVPSGAFAQAAITSVSQNHGAKQYPRVKRCVLTCVICMLCINVPLITAVMLLGKPILALYTPGNQPVMDAAFVRLSIMATTYFLAGCMNIMANTVRGLGRSLSATICSLVGTCGFRILWIYLVVERFHYLWVLYISYPISWALMAVLFGFMAFRTIRKREREMQCALADATSTQ